MENKKTAVEWLYDTIIIFPESIEDLAHNARSFKEAKFIERENILDFALFVKREGWALKTGKNIDDLYNDFLNK